MPLNRIELTDRRDFTLANYAATTRGGSALVLHPAALQAMDCRRDAFIEFLEREPRPWIYNVSGRIVRGQALVVSSEERRSMALRPIAAGAVLDVHDAARCLPERLVRGMIFCRLSNCIEGHSGVRSVVARAIADMLQAPLPLVPYSGHGAAGEMLLLSQLFGALIETHLMHEKEASALVNGAPTAAALLADATLVSGILLSEMLECCALLIAAYGAPLEAYDPALAQLWGNPIAARVNDYLRERACEAARATAVVTGMLPAPVSFRATPRLLGRAVERHAYLQQCAARALVAVTDNPVILDGEPMRLLGNGGFFDADAPAAFDQMAGEYADLVRLLERLVTRLVESSSPRYSATAQFRLRSLVSALTGYAEDAAGAATRTPLPGSDGGGAPQNDLLAPVMQAWNKFAVVCERAASAVGAARAVLSPEAAPSAGLVCQTMYTAVAVPGALEALFR